MNKKWLFLGLGLCASLGLATACSDDDDEQEAPVEPPKEGYASTCRAVQVTYPDDAPTRDKKTAAEYLTSVCKLPEYFVSEEFQSAKNEDQTIGASCFCYGESCNYMGYERPEVGGIASENAKERLQTAMFGCDAVPETYNGAVRSCFRSSEVDGILPAIYFPNGACALAMSKCNVEIEKNNVKNDDGTLDQVKTLAQQTKSSQTICGFATFGDPAYGSRAKNDAYAKNIDVFTSCPNGEVLIDFVMGIEVTALESYADLDIRACFQGCKQDSDCHGAGIFDPIVQKQSNTKCQTVVSADGAKKAGVCFDMATVKGVEKTMVLVDAGNYSIEE